MPPCISLRPVERWVPRRWQQTRAAPLLSRRHLLPCQVRKSGTCLETVPKFAGSRCQSPLTLSLAQCLPCAFSQADRSVGLSSSAHSHPTVTAVPCGEPQLPRLLAMVAPAVSGRPTVCGLQGAARFGKGNFSSTLEGCGQQLGVCRHSRAGGSRPSAGCAGRGKPSAV